ncbi:DNA topoisomerase IB [Arcticibacter eurypsychrophilus]|uniref:DNA topoisomerase IB n=1 Tax=Arcticibacter eurypsychrophilus TaxID=1434752 RepID=UPI00084E0619|nr:DNA topoisomerase IB [Arcticibacter eurypsychrophilus]
MTETEQLLEENDLFYVNETTPGIIRKKNGKGYVYVDEKGAEIADEIILKRIKSLVLPPAWVNVWIAYHHNAHLQATGIDQAGRKQYRYHSTWSSFRNESKFYRLLEFGKRLPEFRRKLQKDLKRKNFDERKVLAISVNFMQKTNIRIGNESYKELYGSYGLSTLRDKHIKIEGSNMKLTFKGKKGVMHDINLTDRNLARLVKKCKDIPGQELFQYYNAAGKHCSIDSGMVNRYLKEVTRCDFTAKDFRTWSGSLEALRAYSEMEYSGQITIRKKTTLAVLDHVCHKLGNTRTVCKKYYIFPPLIEAYEAGSLFSYLKKVSKSQNQSADTSLNSDEKVLLSFLRSERKKRNSLK